MSILEIKPIHQLFVVENTFWNTEGVACEEECKNRKIFNILGKISWEKYKLVRLIYKGQRFNTWSCYDCVETVFIPYKDWLE